MTDVRIEDGKLVVDLAGTFSRLFVDGALQAEFGLGDKGPTDFAEILHNARAAHAACSMMGRVLEELREQPRKPGSLKPAKKTEAFAAGLESGLLGEFTVIGVDRMHGVTGSAMPPDHKLSGPSHRRGWELGSAIHAATELAAGRPDPRASWKKKVVKRR